MQAFTTLDGLVAPLDRPNVDTDAIIPKQFLKSIKRSGFGPNLFDEWRYLDQGEPDKANEGRPLNPEFILNQPRYQGTNILLARDNFGCGSSREHAPWAIVDYGIRAIIAPSFADIFYSNSAKNGLLLVILPTDVVDRLFAECKAHEGYRLTIDLAKQEVRTPSGETFTFDYNAGLKHRMLNGLDDVGITLQRADAIRTYETRRRAQAPWLFAEG
ncbi:MAG: 3-isopropylmalate dehydratase small subunit [Gammaproteobacteria bacterium]|nr:3-isopropylmalate dehydratase small subunit [Gammaproteobacteria bacterium]